MEEDIANKFKRGLKEATPKLCRICYSGLSSKELSVKVRKENKLNYVRFCEVIKYSDELNEDDGGKGYYPVCEECILVVNSAMKRRSKVEDVEGQVGRLQRELLNQLRKLQKQLYSYYEDMEKVKRVIVRKEKETQRAGKVSLMEQLERKEAEWFRYRVVDAVGDLRIFRSRIAQKLLNGHEEKKTKEDQVDPLKDVSDFETADDFEDIPDIKLENCFDSTDLNSVELEDEMEATISTSTDHARLSRGKRDKGNILEDDDYVPSSEENDSEVDDDDEMEVDNEDPTCTAPESPPPEEIFIDLSNTYLEMKDMTEFKRRVLSRIIHHAQQQALKKGQEFITFATDLVDLPPPSTTDLDPCFRYDQMKRKIFLGNTEIKIKDHDEESVQCSTCDYTFDSTQRLLPYLITDHVIDAHILPNIRDKSVVRRRRRMRGEAYLGTIVNRCKDSGKKVYINGIPRDARTLGPPCNSTACAVRKSFFCNKFTEEDRAEIFYIFWKTLNWEEKAAYVQSLVETNPCRRQKSKLPQVRKITNIYHFVLRGKRLRVCSQAFLSTLGIRERNLRGWLTPTPKKPRLKTYQKKQKSDTPPEYPCSTCGRLFNSRTRLYGHEQNHIKVDCPGCGMNMCRSHFDRHKKQSCKVLAKNPEYFVCPHCGRKQKGQSGLRDHLLRLHGERIIPLPTEANKNNTDSNIDKTANVS